MTAWRTSRPPPGQGHGGRLATTEGAAGVMSAQYPRASGEESGQDLSIEHGEAGVGS